MKIIVFKQKALSILCSILALCMVGYVIAYPSIAEAYATNRQLPIYCVDKKQKVCSISFDAAWGDVNLRHIR